MAGRPRKSLESIENPVSSEGDAERGKAAVKDNMTRSSISARTQEAFKNAKVSYKTIRVSNNCLKVAKVEVLPNGDAYQSLAARLGTNKSGKWEVKVGRLNDEMKKVLKERDGVVI